MRIEESKAGFDPQSSILDPQSCFKRVRWRCRRGLLELDIVLGRFIEKNYAGLDESQQAIFDVLLDMPDTELWDMIAGKAVPQEECRAVLELLQSV